MPKYLALFPFIAVVLFAVLMSSCEQPIAEMQRELTKRDLYIERAETVEILYSDSAVVRLRIQAPVLLNHIDTKEPRKEFPDGLKVDFFNEMGVITSTLTAKYAIQFEKESKIIIRKNVVVQSMNNESLETEELIWDERLQSLYTDKAVKVATADELIYGYGFRSNQEFTEWEIQKVNGRFTVENIREDF